MSVSSPIGFFDSGIGGITVLKEAIKLMPNEKYIYFADTKRVPYGTKPKSLVRSYVFDAVNFLVSKDIKALVVACNTATSIAVRDLRYIYNFPIIGMEPAVKPAVEKNGHASKRVLVVATPLTLREEKFHNLVLRVDTCHIVDYLPLPELVTFAENIMNTGGSFDYDAVRKYLVQALSSYNLENYGTIVLGCTHFPFFRKVFESILPKHIDIIDGNIGTVRHLKNKLTESGLLALDQKSSPQISFYLSGVELVDKKKLDILTQLLKA